jgi:peptidoglycan LD-endopeptidase CwlK
MNLNPRSLKALEGVHPHLREIVERAAELTDIHFVVTEGLRSKEKQAALKAAGASRTLNSRHLTGHAVDLAAVVGGEVRWDWPLYKRLAGVMTMAAAELGRPLTWGGDWKSLKDGPHFELPWKEYPL